jgi:hypothetical protein
MAAVSVLLACGSARRDALYGIKAHLAYYISLKRNKLCEASSWVLPG